MEDLVTEQEAKGWIGKFVDLMITKYEANDCSKPDEVEAFGVGGKLIDVIKRDGEVYLILGAYGLEDQEWPISDFVAIEEGVDEKEWKRLGALSLLGV